MILNRKIRWALVALVALAAAIAALGSPEWSMWVVNWGGVHYKLMSGGFLGWFFVRFLFGLDISKIEGDNKSDKFRNQAIAGLALAIMVGLFAHGAATGA